MKALHVFDSYRHKSN